MLNSKYFNFNRSFKKNEQYSSAKNIVLEILLTININPILKKASIQAINTGKEKELILMLKNNKSTSFYFENFKEDLVEKIRNYSF